MPARPSSLLFPGCTPKALNEGSWLVPAVAPASEPVSSLLAAERRLIPLSGRIVCLLVDGRRGLGERGGPGPGREVAVEPALPDAPLRPLRQQAERRVSVIGEVADAFVLFESLNNRGMPLTPVDLIKNYLLAESERKRVMDVDEAFQLWNEMLTNLGDNYATQERFLRHYYNAFKTELPEIPNAPVATRTNLIRIYDTLLSANIKSGTGALVAASRIYGRVTCVVETDSPTKLDGSLRQLMRVQGAPSYVLLMWLLSKQPDLGLSEDHLVQVTDRLTSFFVRRNLTGYPQTYALPKLFMTIIEKISGHTGAEVLQVAAQELRGASSSDDEFRTRLEGPVYEENAEVARFILTTLSEDAMTKETRTDLWRQEKGHFVWTIEHILPQGVNLPDAWKQMLGGAEAAAEAQEADVHR